MLLPRAPPLVRFPCLEGTRLFWLHARYAMTFMGDINVIAGKAVASRPHPAHHCPAKASQHVGTLQFFADHFQVRAFSCEQLRLAACALFGAWRGWPAVRL